MSEHDPGGKVRLELPSKLVSEATYSPCSRYRYLLHRRWEPLLPDRSIMFIMCNPSTATEEVDDPTVRKCRVWADTWQFNHLVIGNIMAYRATNPKELRTLADPVGPDNLSHLRQAITTHQPFVVCAWGCPPPALRYAQDQVVDLLRSLRAAPHVMRLTNGGMPGHPLYLPMNLRPTPWFIYA